MAKEAVRPDYYKGGEIECIDAIKASMTDEEYIGFLKGNAQKYLWRYRQKNGVIDLKKAEWYLNRLSSYYDVLSKKKDKQLEQLAIEAEEARKQALYVIERKAKEFSGKYMTVKSLWDKLPIGTNIAIQFDRACTVCRTKGVAELPVGIPNMIITKIEPSGDSLWVDTDYKTYEVEND